MRREKRILASFIGLSFIISLSLIARGALAARLSVSTGETIKLTDTVRKTYMPIETKGSISSGDPLYDYQWNLRAIDANAAIEQNITGKGVRVAIIDSGINSNHEDFFGTDIAEGHNYIDNTSDTGDSFGHGTFISGIIAAQAGNGVGIEGMADGVTLVPLKVFNGSGGDVRNVIAAIYDAVDVYHCDVINMSFGFDVDYGPLHDAVRYACSKGVILVAAAGNDGTSVADYPASYPDIVGVGSVSYDSQTSSVTESSFSERSGVFVTAPGADIVSLRYDQNDGYAQGDGTSFSTPEVTAMAAMAKQANKNITEDEFKKLLQNSSIDLGDPGKDTLYGYGLVNVKSFISLLQQPDQGAQPAVPGSWNIFNDVSASDWFYNAVSFVFQNHLFQGTGTDTFSPQTDMTRSMFVTVLGRLYEQEKQQISLSADISPFTDAQLGAWYYTYMVWAADNSIVQGYPDNKFGPDDSVTREQIAAFLYRYAQAEGYPQKSTNSQAYDLMKDSDMTSEWAVDAMRWAVDSGIIQGKSDSVLDPGGLATRAEVAQMITRFYNLYHTK